MIPILASDEELIPIVAFVIGGAVGATAIIARAWHRVRVAAYQAHLKDLMIQRGMSAEEIERVVRAEPNAPGRSSESTPRPRRADSWPS